MGETKLTVIQRSGPDVPPVAGMRASVNRDKSGAPLPGEPLVRTLTGHEKSSGLLCFEGQGTGGGLCYRAEWDAGYVDIYGPLSVSLRPADDDRAAWARFLPQSPLPNTGRKDMRKGQVWASHIPRFDSKPTVFLVEGPAKRAGEDYVDVTTLAGDRCTYVGDDSWRAEHAVLLFDVPTEKAASQPSHVCKGTPCGEAVAFLATPDGWKDIWRGGGDGLGFCSPQCRDAWKPEAKRACLGKPCGELLSASNPAPRDWPALILLTLATGDVAFCSAECRYAWKPDEKTVAECVEANRKHREAKTARTCEATEENSGYPCGSDAVLGDDGLYLCSGHRMEAEAKAARSVPPAPAPWKCSAKDCKTPTAGPHVINGRCTACADIDIAESMASRCALTPRAKRRFALESLATFHLPGSIPPPFNGIRRPIDPNSPVLCAGWSTYEEE